MIQQILKADDVYHVHQNWMAKMGDHHESTARILLRTFSDFRLPSIREGEINNIMKITENIE